jgi:hypothetical protein
MDPALESRTQETMSTKLIPLMPRILRPRIPRWCCHACFCQGFPFQGPAKNDTFLALCGAHDPSLSPLACRVSLRGLCTEIFLSQTLEICFTICFTICLTICLFHDMFHDMKCFTKCLFISPDLDGNRGTSLFTICSRYVRLIVRT